MALGHLRIDPWDWPRWTLREFDTAYEGWAWVNIRERWEQVRALSFYSMAPHLKPGALNGWEDVFRLAWDSKAKTKNPAVLRPMTEEEKKEFEFIINNTTKLNG